MKKFNSQLIYFYKKMEVEETDEQRAERLEEEAKDEKMADDMLAELYHAEQSNMEGCLQLIRKNETKRVYGLPSHDTQNPSSNIFLVEEISDRVKYSVWVKNINAYYEHTAEYTNLYNSPLAFEITQENKKTLVVTRTDDGYDFKFLKPERFTCINATLLALFWIVRVPDATRRFCYTIQHTRPMGSKPNDEGPITKDIKTHLGSDTAGNKINELFYYNFKPNGRTLRYRVGSKDAELREIVNSTNTYINHGGLLNYIRGIESVEYIIAGSEFEVESIYGTFVEKHKNRLSKNDTAQVFEKFIRWTVILSPVNVNTTYVPKNFVLQREIEAQKDLDNKLLDIEIRKLF